MTIKNVSFDEMITRLSRGYLCKRGDWEKGEYIEGSGDYIYKAVNIGSRRRKSIYALTFSDYVASDWIVLE